MIPHSRSFLARAGLIVLIALGSCAPEDGPIVIGMPGAWSLPEFETIRSGARMAAEDLNRRSENRGRRVELRFVAHGVNDPASAIVTARTIVADPAVVAGVGYMSSEEVTATQPVFRDRLPFIVPRATNASWVTSEPWVFQLNISDSAFAAEAAREIDVRDWRFPVVLFDNTPGGRGFAAMLLEQLPPHTLFHPLYLEELVGSHDVVIEALRERGADGVLLIVGTRNAPILVPLLREVLPEADLISWGRIAPVVPPELLKELDLLLPDFADDVGAPRDTEFRERFLERFGREADIQAALAYDAVLMVGRAIDAVGTDRKEIVRWLRSARIGSDGGTATGPISFGTSGRREGAGVRVRPGCRGDDLASGRCR